MIEQNEERAFSLKNFRLERRQEPTSLKVAVYFHTSECTKHTCFPTYTLYIFSRCMKAAVCTVLLSMSMPQHTCVDGLPCVDGLSFEGPSWNKESRVDSQQACPYDSFVRVACSRLPAVVWVC